MLYEKFIKPQDVEIKGRTFAISRIPAIDAQPICNAVTKAIADNGILGVTMLPIGTVRDILKFTALRDGEYWRELDTDTRINNTFVDNRDLQELVIRMVRENFGFLITGDLLDLLADKAEATESVS